MVTVDRGRTTVVTTKTMGDTVISTAVIISTTGVMATSIENTTNLTTDMDITIHTTDLTVTDMDTVTDHMHTILNPIIHIFLLLSTLGSFSIKS